MRSSRVVADAIAELRAALTRVDRNTTADRVLRAEASALVKELGAVPVALLVANNHARYVDANRAAALLTGYSRAELLRLSVWDLTPTAKRGDGERSWRIFLERGELSGDYELQKRNGEIIVASFFAAAHVLPGLHVSALTTPGLIDRLDRRASARAPIPSRTARSVRRRRR